LTGHPAETAVFTRRFDPAGAGLRVAVKDTLDMAGEVTTGGSRALVSAEPAAQDAEVVELLRAAGCRIIGRTNMHELAFGVTGVNSWTGTPTNPDYPSLIPGGSSSGSAVAIAAGLADFAVGSDTGGSIRVPAGCCGIVGLKPSFGRVSRAGAVPAYSTLDCIGPFARDVAGVEQAMAIIAPDWRGPAAAGAGKLAFVVTSTDAEIAAMVRNAAADVFDIDDVTFADGAMKVIGRETWDAFGHLTKTGLVGRDVHDRLIMSSTVTDDQLAEAEATRLRFGAAIDAVLQWAEALLLPTFQCAIPSLYEVADPAGALPLTANCRPFNLSGHPAIALPVGEIDGRPVSMQLVGRKGDDEALCALARQIPRRLG
jgi:amidase